MLSVPRKTFNFAIDMKQIPKIIQDNAAEQGFNAVEFIGEREDAQAFSVGCVDEDGEPLPTGLPTVFLLKEDKVTVKRGVEALDLL